MIWTVEIEAGLSLPKDDEAFEDAVDEILDELLNNSDALGPVTFLHRRTRRFGARLAVHAENLNDALGIAVTIFTNAARVAGLSESELQRAKVFSDDIVPVDSSSAVLAGV